MVESDLNELLDKDLKRKICNILVYTPGPHAAVSSGPPALVIEIRERHFRQEDPLGLNWIQFIENEAGAEAGNMAIVCKFPIK